MTLRNGFSEPTGGAESPASHRFPLPRALLQTLSPGNAGPKTEPRP